MKNSARFYGISNCKKQSKIENLCTKNQNYSELAIIGLGVFKNSPSITYLSLWLIMIKTPGKKK
jgi:hypothetical protein